MNFRPFKFRRCVLLVAAATACAPTAAVLLRAEGKAIRHPGSNGPQLEESPSVMAPDGSTRVVPGSMIADRIEAILPALTGAAKADAASIEGDAIRVALGDAAAVNRTISFQTKIK